MGSIVYFRATMDETPSERVPPLRPSFQVNRISTRTIDSSDRSVAADVTLPPAESFTAVIADGIGTALAVGRYADTLTVSTAPNRRNSEPQLDESSRSPSALSVELSSGSTQVWFT